MKQRQSPAGSPGGSTTSSKYKKVIDKEQTDGKDRMRSEREETAVCIVSK